MQTARDLITQAFKVSGIRAPSENPSAEDLQLGLQELNGLVDQWRLDEMWSPGVKTYEFETIGGGLKYTIGVPSTDPLVPAPDWPVVQSILDVHSMQVLIGNVWTPMRELAIGDYYRASQMEGMQVVPTTFAFNRTHDPYDLIMLLNPSAGVWKVRVAINGIVENYTLDQMVDMPSGYFGCMQYGLAMILCVAYGLDSANMTSIYTSRLARIKRVNGVQPPLLKLNGQGGIWSIGSDTLVNSSGGF